MQNIFIMGEAAYEATEAQQELLTDIAAKHKEFTTANTEYLAALQRKISWQEDEMQWCDDDGHIEYPHDYEITQWELKREILEKELQQLINKIKSTTTHQF